MSTKVRIALNNSVVNNNSREEANRSQEAFTFPEVDYESLEHKANADKRR